MYLKKKIYDYLDPREDDPLPEKVFNYFIVALIFINTLAVILDTVEWFYAEYKLIFEIVEYFSVAVFTVELFLRIWTITIIPKYSHPLFGRLKYIFSFYCLIDIFAILPFYFPLIIYYDLRFLRLFRVIRFIRIIKLGRYSKAFRSIANVWKKKKGELIASTSIALIFIVISACVVFLVENEAQPEKYSSIPESIYWSAITISTVGYGDIYPITLIGKVFTILMVIIGVGLIALPSGIIAAGFMEESSKQKAKYCPHCGKEII